MRFRVFLYGSLSIIVAFLDDAPVNGDATLWRGFTSFGDWVPSLTSWYLAHAVLVLGSIIFLVLAVREAKKR